LRLPDLRSGPLYPVPGRTRALEGVAGSVVLAGQDDRVALIDLSDRPGRHAMPIRASAPVPAAVVELGIGAADEPGLARLEDGRLLEVRLSPLAVLDAAEGSIAELRADPPPVSWPAGLVPPPSALGPEPPPTEVEPQTPVVGVEREASAAVAGPETRPAAPGGATSGSEQAPVDAVPEATAPAPPATPPTPLETPSSGVAGRIGGPAAAGVLEVVLFGPDNLLREAKRVAPEADGRWWAGELEPGRYRIQLDGGGGRVVVSEPRFIDVVVLADGGVVAGDLRAIRVLE
jgi:hypothetical protein